MKKTVLMLLAGTAIFTACKKSTDDEVTTTTTQQKIMHKWTYESDSFNNFYSGQSHITVTPGLADDYMDFRTDGKVYMKLHTTFDTSGYSVLNDKQVKIDVDTFAINTLTDNSFVMTLRNATTAGYNETITTMKK